jgi:hypothetical protein
VIELSMTIRMPATALGFSTALRVFAVLTTIATHRLRGAFTGRVRALLCRLCRLHNFDSLRISLRDHQKQ